MQVRFFSERFLCKALGKPDFPNGLPKGGDTVHLSPDVRQSGKCPGT
ncbi:hypothetical protein BW21_1275 [Burkholderia humptydooensis]|nr:hypothetical protein BW21_1275 [Burkholderia sp. 2002721687]